MIRVENLVQHYGIRPVLKNISLEIRKGEVVAIMGPNGMGKTTLLAAMAGLLSPQKGFIEIDGKRRRRTEDEELAVRQITYYLPADPWLPTSRTGREFLIAVGMIYGIDRDRLLEHIDRVLRLFNLSELDNTPITSYSTGQVKKLALAAALVSEAKVFLLDEPFSGGLDPSGLLALRKVLKHLAERDDITICMATPVPEFVEELADRVIVLKDGEVLAFDTIAALKEKAPHDGSLSDVLEQLISPQTAENVSHYFEGSGS